MSKKNIRLEAIDPIEIYGAANKNLEALCSYFPELKVVARGNEIILDGKDTDIEEFETKLKMLIHRREHKMNVTPYDVEDLFDGESSPDRITEPGEYSLQSRYFPWSVPEDGKLGKSRTSAWSRSM